MKGTCQHGNSCTLQRNFPTSGSSTASGSPSWSFFSKSTHNVLSRNSVILPYFSSRLPQTTCTVHISPPTRSLMCTPHGAGGEADVRCRWFLQVADGFAASTHSSCSVFKVGSLDLNGPFEEDSRRPEQNREPNTCLDGEDYLQLGEPQTTS